MKNSELIALLVANANKTQHIRVYSGKWHTGASRIPDRIATKVGYILALLQDKINQGELLEPDQCLLVYNFQPLAHSGEVDFYSMDMLIRPFAERNKTAQNIGKPYQVVINGKTEDVTNNSKYLVDMGYLTLDEIKDDQLEPPIVYGHYPDHFPYCCFVAIAHYRPIDEDDVQAIFEGKFDKSDAIQQSQVFNSWIEANNYLKMQVGSKYIAELPYQIGEFEQRKQQGLGQFILKLFDVKNNIITETPRKEIQQKEDLVDEETVRMTTMINQL